MGERGKVGCKKARKKHTRKIENSKPRKGGPDALGKVKHLERRQPKLWGDTTCPCRTEVCPEEKEMKMNGTLVEKSRRRGNELKKKKKKTTRRWVRGCDVPSKGKRRETETKEGASWTNQTTNSQEHRK